MADLIDRDMAICELEAFRESCIANLLRMSFDDIIDVVKDIPTFNRWIPCSERLPEKDAQVLVYVAGYIGTAYFDAANGIFGLTEHSTVFYQVSGVTHWMQLPEPPESEVQSNDEH